jgi:hypothetical protein
LRSMEQSQASPIMDAMPSRLTIFNAMARS